jgi:ketosteroid isomerase-like protein
MNDGTASEVREIVDRETRAWNTKDAELLLSVFHPDMVWPWPPPPTTPWSEPWRRSLRSSEVAPRVARALRYL